MKKVKKTQPKIVIFTAVKNRCILHGRVFIMSAVHAGMTATIFLFSYILHTMYTKNEYSG